MSLNREKDTVAAIATSQGEGGIAIVRMSGVRAAEILQKAFYPIKKGKPVHAKMTYGCVKDENGETLDEVMAVMFYAPRSYTREDVAEIHCHGGRVCAFSVLSLLIRLGARAAEPGEFTRRAFLNGRIDLSEAEAVMSLIGAKSQAARRASVRQLKGGVSSRVGQAREALLSLMALIDACTDFPEEIDTDATAETVLSRAEAVKKSLEDCSDSRCARILREGAAVVIAGKPNVGKSSLMNAMLACERAIVTDIPGTTRDILTENVELGGVKITLSDTAGIRETGDPIEKMGVERAREALKNADCVLMVMDASDEDRYLLSEADERTIVVWNKCDLTPDFKPQIGIRASAKTGEGIREIVQRIQEIAGQDAFSEDQMTLPRHIECARRAIDAISRACASVEGGVPLDFAAADLREALEALGDITGETMNESVIDRVFADFCVGK